MMRIKKLIEELDNYGESSPSSVDIVERLRTRYKVLCRYCHHFNSDMTVPHEVMREAADEIERLRAETIVNRKI